MSYLHRMVTCPKCMRRVQWRDTIDDAGTCRDCGEDLIRRSVTPRTRLAMTRYREGDR